MTRVGQRTRPGQPKRDEAERIRLGVARLYKISRGADRGRRRQRELALWLYARANGLSTVEAGEVWPKLTEALRSRYQEIAGRLIRAGLDTERLWT